MIARHRIVAALLAAGVAVAAASPARAQWVRSWTTPSARAAGMGGASAAVVWPGPLNPWANPALYGYASGLSLRWNRAGSLSNLRFGVGGVEFGWGGIGLAYDRDEAAAEVVLTDPGGQPLGVADLSFRLDRWGAGVSVSRLLEMLPGPTAEAGIARHADLAFGFARKRAEADLPFGPTMGPRSETDFGLLVHVTPLPGTHPRRLSVDITYGYAALKEPMDRLFNVDEATPEHRRHGAAAQVGLPLWPAGERSFVGWLAQGSDPTLTLTVAADFDQLEGLPAPFGGQQLWSGDYLGGEVEFASALAFRFGHVRDDLGSDDYCLGFGIAPPIGRFVRVRYDYARFPLLDERRSRHTVSAWIDPIAMVRR